MNTLDLGFSVASFIVVCNRSYDIFGGHIRWALDFNLNIFMAEVENLKFFFHC